MIYIEKNNPKLHKDKWGLGEWANEPDKVQFLDEDTSYPCLIVRNNRGSLCGYVGIDKNHPSYEKEYDDVDVYIHGGLTFSSKCQEKNKEFGVCHIEDDGEDDNIWWLGFDCGHYYDMAPWEYGTNNDEVIKYIDEAMPSFNKPFFGSEYRNIDYVKKEIKLLAAQLKSIELK